MVIALTAGLAILPWGRWTGSRIDLGGALAGPSWAHPLGTDNLGRDLLARLAEALAGGVLPLWGAVLAGSLVGLAWALAIIALGRLRGGWPLLGAAFDSAAAVVAAVPIAIVALAWAALTEQAGASAVVMALSGLFAVRSYLQLRDHYRQDARLAYWTAHEAMGGSLGRRLWSYGIKGGWTWALAESSAFHLRAAVAIEASLSYLGFGIQEPAASFGNMLASHFDLYLKGRWEVLVLILMGLTLTAVVPGSLVRVLLWCRDRRLPR